MLSAPMADGAQQIEISPAHELQSHTHESDCPATQVVRSPRRAGRDTRSAEENFRNLAICRAGKMTIESAESKHELLTLKARERIGPAAVSFSHQKSPEPHGGI
jgi:hypothetical protein